LYGSIIESPKLAQGGGPCRRPLILPHRTAAIDQMVTIGVSRTGGHAMECPHAELAPLSASYLADPYPVFEQLRRRGPVFYDSDLDMYLVTRHADIETVFRDHAVFSAANVQDPVFPLHDDAKELLADAGFRKLKTMSNADGAMHTRIRQHNLVGFSPRRLRSLEPLVRSTVRSLIDAMTASGSAATGPAGPVDVVDHLAFPLPASIIFALLGFPPEDTPMLKEWGGDRLSFSWGRPTAASARGIAEDMLAYWSYCVAHVERRLAAPADDFTSDLLKAHLADPSALSQGEIAHVIYGMSFAGHETTTNLIANTVRRVLSIDGVWDEIKSDRAVIPKVVDEVLRFDTSVVTWRRVTTVETTLGGVDLPAGAKVLLLVGSANRDETVFADPERFDVHRQDGARHLSFGFGKHYCLGATLAKLEVGVTLEELATRLPGLRLADAQSLPFHPNVSFRGPRTLMVTWTESSGS
jgi:cytochrome P450